MILELDIGNSRLKWRLLTDGGVRLDGGFAPHLPEPGHDYPWRQPGRAAPERARIASVADASFNAALVRELEAEGTGRIDFARSTDRCGRLVSGYREPERMGVDRWLALAAAADLCPGAFVVVDAGSAITLDLVATDGVHQGGWIVPGLRMMRSALLAGTAGIRLPKVEVEAPVVPGRDTAEAVGFGTVLLARDFVERRVGAFREQFPDAPLFVTGGDGERIAPTSLAHRFLVPELVLDGLTRASF